MDPTHMKNRPAEYRGPLTASQIAEGMNAARRNARRLVSDAKILLDANRYPTATALAALSIEESGKASILRQLAGASEDEAIRAAWKDYRDHRSKNGMWILPLLAQAGARRLDELAECVNRDGDHTTMLNSLKQLGFYTDCYGDAHWSEPHEIFDGEQIELAKQLVATAELLARGEEVTTREIELWIEHMRPTRDPEEGRYALLRFADAMCREGLSKVTLEEYIRFIFGEAGASDWKQGEPPKTH